jgi:hypothetical protein
MRAASESGTGPGALEPHPESSSAEHAVENAKRL